MDEFETVYREKASMLLRYLAFIGCPTQDAEDVVQDTFVKALVNIDSFRGEGSLDAWLRQIAKNTWYSKLKRKKRAIQEPEYAEYAVEESHEGLLAWLDMIGRLPEPYRGVFERRAVEGWDYGRIAKAAGRSESCARVTYRRARLRLLDMLEDGENES